MFAFSLRKSRAKTAQRLYQAALAQARRRIFYTEYAVPDTVDGRYEVIVLHVYQIMEGLRKNGTEGEKILQPLFDCMFRDFEYAAREMGIGDLSIPRHMKRMMQGFHGRATSYRKLLMMKKIHPYLSMRYPVMFMERLMRWMLIFWRVLQIMLPVMPHHYRRRT